MQQISLLLAVFVPLILLHASCKSFQLRYPGNAWDKERTEKSMLALIASLLGIPVGVWLMHTQDSLGPLVVYLTIICSVFYISRYKNYYPLQAGLIEISVYSMGMTIIGIRGRDRRSFTAFAKYYVHQPQQGPTWQHLHDMQANNIAITILHAYGMQFFDGQHLIVRQNPDDEHSYDLVSTHEAHMWDVDEAQVAYVATFGNV